MSRRPVANRRELLLPLLMPDRHQTDIVFDPCVPAGPSRTSNGKDVTTPFVDGAEASARVPVPPEVATLFTQLGRRRLRSRATQEAP